MGRICDDFVTILFLKICQKIASGATGRGRTGGKAVVWASRGKPWRQHPTAPGCVGSNDETLRVWDLESGQTIRSLEGHRRPVKAVAVTPDGRCAISGWHDGTLRHGPNHPNLARDLSNVAQLLQATNRQRGQLQTGIH